MRTFRVTLAVLVIVAAAAMIVRGVLPRIECNREKGRINRDARQFGRSGDEYARMAQAHANLLSLRHCLAIYPEDFQLHMLAGANLRILGSAAEALQSYERALTIAERPEIYAQMAEIEIERGNPEAGRRLMLKAATFNILLADMVDQPMRGEIQAEVRARHERLLAARRQ